MPFNASVVAAVVVFFVSVAVYAKTKKIGATAAVLIGGFMVVAAADPSFLQLGADGVKRVFRWGISQIHL